MALPAEAIVDAEALAAAAEEGRFPSLRLPSGQVPVKQRALPLRPQPLDRVFPLGAASVPWRPARGGGVADLARSWQGLLREREAFTPWGPPDPVRDRQALRLLAPRTTFRARPGTRELAFLYPQLVPADLLYRLGAGYLRLPDRSLYEDLAGERPDLHLTALGRKGAAGPQATLTRRPTGAWRATCGEREAVSADAVAALHECLEPVAALWRAEMAGTESSLLIVARS